MPTLPSNVSSLTAAEKSELIDALWEDLESHGYTLSPEQAEELDRRIDSCEKNPPTGIPWEQVKAGRSKAPSGSSRIFLCSFQSSIEGEGAQGCGAFPMA